MKRALILSAIVAAAGISLAASAFQAPPRPDAPKVVELQKIKDNLYVATGGGGNSAIFITDLGVVVVDTKNPGWGQPLLAKIKTITTKPVVTLINTHSHPDHVGSNEYFGTAVEIVAHENARLAMDKMDAFKDAKVNYLPKLMFRDTMSLGAGKDKIELHYFGPGHTNGDAWVVFPAARVVHAGDMFAGKQPPLVDLNSGGSSLAYPESLEKAFASIKNVDTIITGHSATTLPWSDLKQFAELARDFREMVVSGFHHGQSIDEIAAAWTLPAKYAAAGYTAAPNTVKSGVRAIVGELTR